MLIFIVHYLMQFRSLPAGWSLAPDDTTTHLLLASSAYTVRVSVLCFLCADRCVSVSLQFGSSCVVLSTGAAYTPGSNVACGTSAMATTTVGSTTLYRSSLPNRRLLISRTATGGMSARGVCLKSTALCVVLCCVVLCCVALRCAVLCWS